jgi:hypothetical protein
MHFSSKRLSAFQVVFHLGLRKLRMPILSINKLRHLSLSFPTLDDFLEGLELGDFVVVRGNAASCMSFVLSVQSQLPIERGGLSLSTVFVDGGNLFSLSIAEIPTWTRFRFQDCLEKGLCVRSFHCPPTFISCLG